MHLTPLHTIYCVYDMLNVSCFLLFQINRLHHSYHTVRFSRFMWFWWLKSEGPFLTVWHTICSIYGWKQTSQKNAWSLNGAPTLMTPVLTTSPSIDGLMVLFVHAVTAVKLGRRNAVFTSALPAATRFQ